MLILFFVVIVFCYLLFRRSILEQRTHTHRGRVRKISEKNMMDEIANAIQVYLTAATTRRLPGYKILLTTTTQTTTTTYSFQDLLYTFLGVVVIVIV